MVSYVDLSSDQFQEYIDHSNIDSLKSFFEVHLCRSSINFQYILDKMNGTDRFALLQFDGQNLVGFSMFQFEESNFYIFLLCTIKNKKRYGNQLFTKMLKSFCKTRCTIKLEPTEGAKEFYAGFNFIKKGKYMYFKRGIPLVHPTNIPEKEEVVFLNNRIYTFEQFEESILEQYDSIAGRKMLKRQHIIEDTNGTEVFNLEPALNYFKAFVFFDESYVHYFNQGLTDQSKRSDKCNKSVIGYYIDDAYTKQYIFISNQYFS